MLHLHAADRVEPLADLLAGVLLERSGDPFDKEWVAVPSVGMRRWLSLALAHRLGATPGRADGVAANIGFGFPGELRSRVFAAGRDGSEDDPWSVARLTWTVLGIADGEPDGPLPTALSRAGGGVSRFGVARRVADLFDSYHVHRPEMVRRWATGADVDDTGTSLHERHRWQPELWRRCRALIVTPSPAEELPGLLERVRAGDLDRHLELPGRLALFGLTQLPGGPDFLDLAEAVGRRREVHVLLLEPSTAVRSAIDTSASGPGGPERPRARLRSDDDSGGKILHPLLRSWGRQHRETAVLLDSAGLGVATEPDPTGSEDPPRTLLAQLQSDLRNDRAPDATWDPAPDDRSIQLHACHGATRQVEVLRDAILHLLADRPDLNEDDVVVLCPQLETFAPVIEGVFGPSAPTGTGRVEDDEVHAPALRYRIADRSLRSTNPVLEAVTGLVDLLVGRFDVPAVLDLAALAPVRRRYAFGDDDLARLADWAEATNVRWGIDTRHRSEFGVPEEVVGNSWRDGLDRLLVGMAVTGDGIESAVGDVAPYDVEGGDVAVLGRFAELFDRLERLQREVAVPRPIDGWIDLVTDAADDLFAVEPDQRWQVDRLHRVLHDVGASARFGVGRSTTLLTFTDLRRILDVELRAAPGRADFFRGGVTVTSMTPLRGLPFRVVCLLGVDEDALQPVAADGDDLLAAAARVGDRDARADLRQALLDSVLVARDTLVVVRSGHDVRTNHEIPPAVVVAELIDTLEAMVTPGQRKAYLERIDVDHPRQAFDATCFLPARIVPGPWSFDPGALAGAEARRSRAFAGPHPFLRSPLDPPDDLEITLPGLHAFLRHPVKTFLTERLGIRLPVTGERTAPVLPLELGGLEAWQAGERLLAALRSGHSVDEWQAAEGRIGTLPPGVLATGPLRSIETDAAALHRCAEAFGVEPGGGRAVPVDVRLGDGRRVAGTVVVRIGVGTPGPCLVTYSRTRAAHRLTAWLDLMMLVGTDPDTEWRSVTIARGGRDGDEPVVENLVAVGDDPSSRRAAAITALEGIVDLYRRGLCEPLPLFAELSAGLATDQMEPGQWDRFRPPRGRGGDRHDDWNHLVYGRYDLRELLALEATGGDPDGLGGRVRRYAAALWDLVGRTSITVDGVGPAGEGTVVT